MSAVALWFVGGLVLAGAEMVAPGAFLLPIGLAAMGAGGVALLGASPHWQFVAFVAAALVLVTATALVLRRRVRVDRLNAPGAGLVGERCRALAFEGQDGRVAYRDGQWQARLLAGQAAPGDALRIAGLDGTVLLVRPEQGATP